MSHQKALFDGADQGDTAALRRLLKDGALVDVNSKEEKVP